MKARRKDEKHIKTCGECEHAAEDRKHRTITTREYFCVTCRIDGLLKMKKWKCDKPQIINLKHNKL